MPRLISRSLALERIREEVDPSLCLMCALRDDVAGDRWVIAEDDHLLAVLPRYVRRWGQLLIILKPHLTRYTELEPELWSRAQAWAHRGACVIEAELKPRRCYVASTGSAAEELTQSSVHLHVHVIPLYDAEDRPSDVFSWSKGVYVAERDEWATLRATVRRRWLELS